MYSFVVLQVRALTIDLTAIWEVTFVTSLTPGDRQSGSPDLHLRTHTGIIRNSLYWQEINNCLLILLLTVSHHTSNVDNDDLGLGIVHGMMNRPPGDCNGDRSVSWQGRLRVVTVNCSELWWWYL